jgi:hypothetical protein
MIEYVNMKTIRIMENDPILTKVPAIVFKKKLYSGQLVTSLKSFSTLKIRIIVK